ncbi:MAG: molybdopterin-guanine dinucleotide biosynthesis protein B [Cohnella sp.]|nr:molybdopterin-guanine dinucleotide biosynthesis protein B [Cohnella sp.]
MVVLQIAGYKNSGKTTLASAVVRRLSSRGCRIGTIKHDAHEFEPDVPGTDSWKHREAGAYATAITSKTRTAWTLERPTPLDELLGEMRSHALDAVIVEGFKDAPYPKVVLLRDEADADLLNLPNIVAAALRQRNDRLEEAVRAANLPSYCIEDAHLDDLLDSLDAWVASAITRATN